MKSPIYGMSFINFIKKYNPKRGLILTKFLKHAVFMNNLRNKLEYKKRQALP